MFLESNSNGAIKLLFILILQIIGFFISPTAKSKIDPYAGKGLLDIFKDKERFFSPLIGLAALESGKIDKIYHDGTHDHSLHQLARYLFHKVDTDLLATQLATNPAAHLSPQSIGKIFRLLRNYPFKHSHEPCYELITEIKVAIVLDKTYYTSHMHTIERFNNKKREIDEFKRKYDLDLQKRKAADALYKDTLTRLNREIKKMRKLQKSYDIDFDESLDKALELSNN
ncbi:MAG: hypothetical protein AB8G05_20080 [Oligoflexales bacterium]